MEQLLNLFIKYGLKPLSLSSETILPDGDLQRSELAALLIVDIHGERTMSELANDLGTPLSTLTGVARRLVRKGLIQRNQSDKDQRIIVIRLTAAGEQVAKEARAVVNERLKPFLNSHEQQETERFLSLAIEIMEALDQKALHS